MSDLIASVDVYIVELKQDKPYLGNLREGETVNPSGYFVRKGNRTVYPMVYGTSMRSLMMAGMQIIATRVAPC